MNINSEVVKEESKTFKQRIVRASFWSSGSHLLNQAIRLGSNLIMTRLLMPEYFGLMAIANVFIFGLIMMSDMGLRQSLIQSKRFDQSFINTVWTLQVLRGCVIWIFSLLAALLLYRLSLIDFWPKESVYQDPLLPYIVASIGISALIGGFESTKLAISSRELSLVKNVAIGLISQIFGIIVMISWALLDKSVWPMVAAAIVSSLVTTILSHIMFGGIRNQFHWDKAAFEQIFNFGKWIFVSSILGFLLQSSDRLLLGAMVDARLLGLYAIAFFIVGALKDLICNVIHNVGFPALSEAYRVKPDSLKEVYYKLRLPFDLVSILGAGFLFATGEIIVRLLYDDRYVTAGWIIQILSVGLFQLRYNLAGECFMAMGKPKILTILILLDIVLLYMLAYLGFNLYGFKGFVWAVVITSNATIPFVIWCKYKYKLLDWKRELLVLPLLPLGYGFGWLAKQSINLILS